MDKFVRGKVLGKGSFGCAVLVTSKVDGKNYVIKEIDVSRMPKAERDSAEQEAKVGRWGGAWWVHRGRHIHPPHTYHTYPTHLHHLLVGGWGVPGGSTGACAYTSHTPSLH